MQGCEISHSFAADNGLKIGKINSAMKNFFHEMNFTKIFVKLISRKKFALFLKIFSLTVLLLVLMDPKVVVSIAGEVKVWVPFPKRSTGLNIGI